MPTTQPRCSVLWWSDARSSKIWLLGHYRRQINKATQFLLNSLIGNCEVFNHVSVETRVYVQPLDIRLARGTM